MNSRHSTDDLYAQLESLKLKIALAEMADEDAENAQAGPAVSLSEAGETRIWQAIRKAFQRRKRERFFRRTLPRLSAAAAALLLVFFIGLSVAIAASDTVRVQFLQFVMRMERVSTELGFSNRKRPKRMYRQDGRDTISRHMFRRGLRSKGSTITTVHLRSDTQIQKANCLIFVNVHRIPT